MNLNEMQDLINDLHSIAYEQKQLGNEIYYTENDRPIGMKKDSWETLVYAVDELNFILSREIIKQEKQFLVA
jgi:hypothetical protein